MSGRLRLNGKERGNFNFLTLNETLLVTLCVRRGGGSAEGVEGGGEELRGSVEWGEWSSYTDSHSRPLHATRVRLPSKPAHEPSNGLKLPVCAVCAVVL